MNKKGENNSAAWVEYHDKNGAIILDPTNRAAITLPEVMTLVRDAKEGSQNRIGINVPGLSQLRNVLRKVPPYFVASI